MKKPPSQSFRIKLNGNELSESELNTRIDSDDAFRDQLDNTIDTKLLDLTKMEGDCLKFYDKKVCKKITDKPRKIYTKIKKKIQKTKSVKGKSTKK